MIYNDLSEQEILEVLKKEASLNPQHHIQTIEGVNATMQFLRDTEGNVKFTPRKRIMGYDLDGVIFSMSKAIQLTNEKLGTKINIHSITSLQYDLVYYATMEDNIQLKIIKESLPNPKMVQDLAEEHLSGSEIILITARHVEYAKETIHALNRFGIYYDKIYFTENKIPLIEGLDIDWFYDDKPSTIEQIKQGNLRTKAVLVSAPYNREAKVYDYRYKVGIE